MLWRLPIRARGFLALPACGFRYRYRLCFGRIAARVVTRGRMAGLGRGESTARWLSVGSSTRVLSLGRGSARVISLDGGAGSRILSLGGTGML
jgi:hypothetical protein